MSQTLLALASGLAGALVAFLGTYFTRLRQEFAVRAGALQVIKSDLEFALLQIDAARETYHLWSPHARLSPRGWELHRSELVSRLSLESWREVDRVVRQLDVTDGWAAERRAAKEPLNSEFAQNLKTLRKDLLEVISYMDDALKGSRSRHTIGWTTACVAVVAVIAVLIVALLSGPNLTSNSLASAIRAQSQGADLTICDKSTELDGAYTCTVDFPRCAGNLNASTKRPACTPPRRDTYDVKTDGDCYAATLIKRIRQGGPSPRGKLKRSLILSGCRNG